MHVHTQCLYFMTSVTSAIPAFPLPFYLPHNARFKNVKPFKPTICLNYKHDYQSFSTSSSCHQASKSKRYSCCSLSVSGSRRTRSWLNFGKCNRSNLTTFGQKTLGSCSRLNFGKFGNQMRNVHSAKFINLHYISFRNTSDINFMNETYLI